MENCNACEGRENFHADTVLLRLRNDGDFTDFQVTPKKITPAKDIASGCAHRTVLKHSSVQADTSLQGNNVLGGHVQELQHAYALITI